MITVTKKDLIELGYGTSFAADIIREAKKQADYLVESDDISVFVLRLGGLGSG